MRFTTEAQRTRSRIIDRKSQIVNRKVKPLGLFPEEREILLPRAKPDMAAWAREHYVLPRETAQIYGRWSSEYVPFWLEPMQWWGSGTLRQLNAAACTQAGKTEFANIAMGYAADVDPGPFLICLPTEDVAKQRLATRIRPMFRSNPRLMRKIGNKLDNFNIGKETILDDMILYVGWANSAITLSDKPIRYVVFDEPTKYPSAVGSDTDPISLGKRRQRGFTINAKTYCCSSPVLEDDLFWREWQKGDPYDWHVPCPKCGAWHQLAWEHVQLDKDDRGRLLDPKEYARGNHAFYACPKCHKLWTEYQRWQAVSAGRWVQAGAHVTPEGSIEGGRPAGPVRSIRIWAGMLHPIFQTMDGLAAEWAQAQLAKHQGNTKPLQDFINNQLAGPWTERAKDTPVDVLRSHLDALLRTGLVPEKAVFLTRGIDVQLDHVYVVEVAWGDLSECWVTFFDRIDTGDTLQLSNWGPLESYLKSGTPLAVDSSKRMHPAMASIDCAYHTEETLAFCRQCQRQGIPIIPARGSEHMRRGIVQPFKDVSKQILRYDFNEDYYKGILHSMLFEAAAPGPGYMHLPADATDEFLAHLTSEEAREIPIRGRRVVIWVNKGGKPNHWWDCLVHARNAAEKVGVRWLDPKVARSMRIEGRPVGHKPIRTRY